MYYVSLAGGLSSQGNWLVSRTMSQPIDVDKSVARAGRPIEKESDMTNYPLRLPEDLMRDVRDMAEAQGVSINQFLSTMIAERLGELKMLRHVRARITRANPEQALDILSRVPDITPAKGDEIVGQ